MSQLNLYKQTRSLMTIVNKKLTVSDIMVEHLYLLNATDSIQKAAQMFEKFNVRHLPIVSDGKIQGMLSKTDVARLGFDPSFVSKTTSEETTFLDNLTVGDVMKVKVKCVCPTDNLLVVAKRLASEEFHAFPVIDENDHLVGIITTSDIINYLLRHFAI